MHKNHLYLLSTWLLRSVVGVICVGAFLPGALYASTAYASGGEAIYSLLPVHYDPAIPATKSYFIFDMHPGAMLESSVRITNGGTAMGTASLVAVDATTGQTSGTVFSSATGKQQKAGTWISLSVHSVTLAPGESRVIPFQVVVPSDAGPGQHVGGIVATSPIHKMAGNKTPLHINIQQLSGIAVQVNLPGPTVEQLSASGIQAGGANGYQNVSIALKNGGNVMIKPAGSLQLLDDHEHLLETVPMKLDTLLPDTSINYPIYIQKQMLGSGKYHAVLKLTYGHSHTLNYTAGFTVTQQQVERVLQSSGPWQDPGTNILNTMPWWQMVLIVLLGACGAAFLGQNLYRLARTMSRKSRSK